MKLSAGDSDRRVVVTGFGVVSSVGNGRARFLRSLLDGRCGVGPISRFDTTGFPHARSYEVNDFEPADHLRRVDPAGCGRVSAQAAATARMAVSDAEFDLAGARTERGVVAIGTTAGESLEVDGLAAAETAAAAEAAGSVEFAGAAESSGTVESGRWVPADIASRVAPGRLSVTVAAELGLSNVEAITVPTVCGAGNYALCHGMDAIRLGDAEFAVCGGADAVSRMSFAGFTRLRAWAPEQVRPFDRDREGFMFGDGAAVLVLENLERARRRGATILAELTGAHLNCDAEHPTKPSTTRVEQCMAGALRDARTDPSEVDLLFAHGTGTRLNDPMEVQAIHGVFGSDPPPVTALKSMIGHTMGAAGAHACIAGLLGIEHDFIPPTVNFANPDPECDIDCVPNVARKARLDTVLVNGLGVGGNNAAIVLRRQEEQ